MFRNMESHGLTFRLNPHLDVDELKGAFIRSSRIHLIDLVGPDAAAALYQYLVHDAEWATFVVANAKRYGLAGTGTENARSEGQASLLNFAYRGAYNGFAAIHDTNRLSYDLRSLYDATGQMPNGQSPEISPFATFVEFLNSSAFLEFMRGLTGLRDIGRTSAQAVRFLPGHFVGFQEGTRVTDMSGRRLLNFIFDLTPEWKPEWGGLLGFRSLNGSGIDGFFPSFNALDVFAFPQGHWISLVAPFAGGARLSIAGGLYES